jgi:hypothetical protein
MSNVKLDLVIYLGDPDANAPTMPISQAAAKADELKSKLSFSEGVYGAIEIKKNNKVLGELKPDPAIGLITQFIKAIPFLIDGEPEQASLSESDFRFALEPQGDDVLISFFEGDFAEEPEDFLIEPELFPLEGLANQVIVAAEGLLSLIKSLEPELLQNDDYILSLIDVLDAAKKSFRDHKLRNERGVRR